MNDFLILLINNRKSFFVYREAYSESGRNVGTYSEQFNVGAFF